jgi:hypothetical protein
MTWHKCFDTLATVLAIGCVIGIALAVLLVGG